MHETVMNFGRGHLSSAVVAGKRVLEVGSYNVNGTIRDHIAPLGPAVYLGVDVNEGPGVDMVCSANELEARLGPTTFDVVVSTEMLEHAQDWRAAINNMKRVLRVGGKLLLTTRSAGFPYHNPPDHWRFEAEHMRAIFADFRIVEVSKDPQVPGIMIFCEKISDTLLNLSNINVPAIEVP